MNANKQVAALCSSGSSGTSMTSMTSMTSKQIFEYNGNTVSVDLTNVKFCPGPCNCSVDEPEPSIYTLQKFEMNISAKTEYVYSYKPYSGGKYAKFCYPINDTQMLVLNNLRICSSCHHRYLEFTEENCVDELKKDANIIMKKLQKNISK